MLINKKLKHRDGRISYVSRAHPPSLCPSPALTVVTPFQPLFLLYWAPQTSSLDQSTLYASALSNFSVKADVAKIVDVRDGEISTQQLDERLGA